MRKGLRDKGEHMGYISEKRWVELINGATPTKKESEAIAILRKEQQEIELRGNRIKEAKNLKRLQIVQQQKSRNGRRNIRKRLKKLS